MGKYFETNYKKITYPIDSKEKRGLRNAQLGAIHAIAAFFSTNEKDAAIVVMPTGSGKTTVIMLAPYLLRKKRVLIVTRSRMVCGQIAEDFSDLKTLRATNVFSDSMKKPNIYEMEHLYSEDQQHNFEKADVIVATPQAALSISKTQWAKENIDLIEVDEAHHSPAKTWHQILLNIPAATQILYTATPFRLDEKKLTGEIVYDYPLAMAYKDGIFGEIKYVPVESGEDNDLLIAKTAEETLANDRLEGYEHYLMIRTDTKTNADLLVEIYKKNTSLRVSKVDSSMSNGAIKRILEKLHKGELDGIICVDMLGEGYDFPNLKIAAIHTPHKSLASTLQFIGRFARTNAKNIGMAKFIAVNDEELEIENYLLYSKDAIWQDMIIGMSEGKNKKEVEDRNYIKEFTTEAEKIMDSVPIQAIKPNCHVKIYRAETFNLYADFPLACNVAKRIMRNKNENTIIGIGIDYEMPLWLENGERINREYALYIIHYQQDTKLLHIYSQKHSETIYNELAATFCASAEAVSKEEIYRVLGGLKDYAFYNSGMVSKQSQSGESYRILTGSNVSDAIDRSSGRLYSAGHAFCKATDEKEGEITIGYSSASKVWSSAYRSLKEYVQWCNDLGRKIANKNLVVKTYTGMDFIPLPKRLRAYPENIFFANFNENTYISDPVVKSDSANSKFPACRLTDAKIVIRLCEASKVVFEVILDEMSEVIECDKDARYKSLGRVFVVCQGNNKGYLDDYLTEQPLIFKSTKDDTIKGTEWIEGDNDESIFDNDIVEGIDWQLYNTDLSLEFRKDSKDQRVSIQDALYEILKSRDCKYILYDHSKGEIADYITFTERNAELIVELYHVKKMSATTYNNSVDDLYEVIGQAMKSVMWFKTKGTLIAKMKERYKGGNCMVKIGGDFQMVLNEINKTDKVLRGSICVVQPGIKKNLEIPEKLQEILAAADTYIKRAGKVNRFRILGSK